MHNESRPSGARRPSTTSSADLSPPNAGILPRGRRRRTRRQKFLVRPTHGGLGARATPSGARRLLGHRGAPARLGRRARRVARASRRVSAPRAPRTAEAFCDEGGAAAAKHHWYSLPSAHGCCDGTSDEGGARCGDEHDVDEATGDSVATGPRSATRRERSTRRVAASGAGYDGRRCPVRRSPVQGRSCRIRPEHGRCGRGSGRIRDEEASIRT